MADEEVDKIVRSYFCHEEWENLPDILKNRYRNMYRHYTSIPGGESFMPLPDFMKRNGRKKSQPEEKASKTKTVDNISQRRNPKRNTVEVNYYETEEPSEDRYIFCDNCGQEYLDACSKCGMLVSLKDYPVAIGTVDRAKKTIPKGILEIRPSPIHGFGVFALRNLRKGIQMGPYQGQATRVDTSNGYSWKLRDGRLIDASDEKNSNWMRYVNCARNVNEQNVVAFQYKGQLYYRTCKEVQKNEEMLVYYGQSFAKNLGIDPKKYFQPDEEEVNLDYYTCQFCHIGLSLREYRDDHENRCKFRPNHRRFYSKEEEYICKHCQCCITTAEYLERHEKYCKKRKNGAREARENVGVGELVGREFQCQYCRFKSGRKDSLQQHVRVIHERATAKLFYCEKCKFKTYHKRNLMRHQRTHEANAMYKCGSCQRGFNQKRDLDNHLLKAHKDLHHMVTSKIHWCKFCDYKTVYKTHLMHHIKHKHSATNEKKFHCDKCGYSAIQKSNLQRHLLTHSNTRRFVCLRCKRGFNHKQRLDSHVLHHHPQNSDLMGAVTNKIHQCKFCTYKTVIKTSLVYHVKHIHSIT